MSSNLVSLSNPDINIKGLVFLLPQLAVLAPDLLVLLKWVLHVCVNSKELVVLFSRISFSTWIARHIIFVEFDSYLVVGLQFKLTKFVNRYFPQDNIDNSSDLSQIWNHWNAFG